VKRFVPFIIIISIALLTLGVAMMVYRAKTGPASTPLAGVAGSPAKAQKPEDPTHVRGPSDAPVTLEIFGDFQCPSCAVVSKGIDEMQRKDADKVRIVFREFPLEMHRHAMQAALAAEAAAIQGKFWEMHDKLYENQPVWSEATTVNFLFESYADAIGLDVARFRADRIAPDVRARVLADMKDGDQRQVKSTPTVFLNGVPLRAGFAKDELQRGIEAALAPKKQS
jgi:protein-disulfide isomerase